MISFFVGKPRTLRNALARAVIFPCSAVALVAAIYVPPALITGGSSDQETTTITHTP